MVRTNTTSGLRAFVDKFAATKVAQSDVIATLQFRVERTRKLTSDSLKVSLACGMIDIDISEALIVPAKLRGLNQQIPASLDQYLKASRRLGSWMSTLSIFEIAATLRLVF